MILSWLTDNLAVSGKIDSDNDVKQLLAHGITHVLNLRTENVDNDFLQERLDRMMQTKVGGVSVYQGDLDYCWNPTADDGKPKPTEWFKISRDFAMPPLLGGGPAKVLCHCKAGYNRGPSTGYFLLRCLGWPPMAARWRVYLKRPICLFGGQRYNRDAELALKALGYE